jgi:hypothetical protein
MDYAESETYISLIGAIAFFIASVIAFRLWSRKRGKVLFFFFFNWLFNGLFLLFDYLSAFVGFEGDVELAVFFFRIEYSVFYALQLIFWLAFLDYAQNDGLGWKKVSLGVGAAVAMFLFMWFPINNVTLPYPPVIRNGDLTLEFTFPAAIVETWFNWLVDVYSIIFAITFLYWTVITHRAAPADIKGKSKALLAAGLFLLLSVCSNSLLTDFSVIDTTTEDGLLISTILGVVVYAALLLATFISSIVISKEPKIIHLLPYKVYRLFISSKAGTPYYEKAWSEHEVNAIMTAGLLSAIGSFAKETLKDVQAGSISEIQMRKGILLTEMQYSPVNIGLLASKASKDLRDALSKFSEEFVKVYYNEIYDKDGFPVSLPIDQIPQIFVQAKVDEIVSNHFSNIPSFIRPGLSTDQLMSQIDLKKEETPSSSSTPDTV